MPAKFASALISILFLTVASLPHSTWSRRLLCMKDSLSTLERMTSDEQFINLVDI
jgi:hypothetical protein